MDPRNQPPLPLARQLLCGIPRRCEAAELLDLPGPSVEAVRGNLQDMQFINHFFRGKQLVLKHLQRMLSQFPPSRKLTLLDVGTGSADIPRAIVDWARKQGRPIAVIAVDRNAHVLAFACQEIASYPEIHLIKADGLQLPLAEQSVDIALASLLCHHLSPPHLAQLLHTFDRLARYGFLVNDLQRSYVAYAVTWLFTRLMSRNPLTRHDGPLSVLRAYRIEELQTIAASVGMEGIQFSHHLFFRLLAIKEKD
jgi:ubiquinone/menaquinone biosynthesis C-methylase UbiE